MAFTVVPLHHLALPAGSVIPFGKFIIKDVPDWLKKESNDICPCDRLGTRTCKQALISEYDDDSCGHPDPEWRGQQPRSIQELRCQSAMLANMCMWMIRPSKICFTVCFHAITKLDSPVVCRVDREGPIYCHPKDAHNPVTPQDLEKAAKLFETLSTVPRKNDVWPALRAFWAALASRQADYRYPLFWQGLESLFGKDKYHGVGLRLRERISYFLAKNAAMQQELCEKVKACYSVRSAIVHGRWEDDPKFDDHMYTTEAIVRIVMRHMADEPGMLQIFLSSGRDRFLDAWARSKAFSPPAGF